MSYVDIARKSCYVRNQLATLTISWWWFNSNKHGGNFLCTDVLLKGLVFYPWWLFSDWLKFEVSWVKSFQLDWNERPALLNIIFIFHILGVSHKSKTLFWMLIQRLWGGRGGIVYCCNVYILYLKSLSFDEVTELYFFLFISINNLIPIQTICFIQVLFIPMPIPIAVLILLKINLASLKKVKLISTFFQSHKITGAFYTLSIFVE